MQSPPKPCAFESDLALLLSAFVAEKQRLGFKYNSIEAYLKSFDTFLLEKDCKNSLSKELMLEWIAPKAHQSATTIEHRIHIMQRLADFLNRNGFPAYRISSELIPRKTHDFIPYIFTYDEITRILAVVDGFTFNKCSPKRHIVYPLLFRVLCFCGLRISEALNLTVGDVHFEDGFFLLRNTKTSLDRIIPLDDNLRARFVAYREQMGFFRKDEYFFPSPNGSRYSLATMDTTFRDILFSAGIPYRGRGKGPRLHDLRHTFCVHSLQELTAHGEDPYAVLPLLMTYMGHRSVQATSQYIHLSAESFPAILKQSEALFGNLIPLEDISNETSI
ncbi:tyrosine-type recombinase/integrase [Ruthenibacterium lactatiformans]|uniref:tyrosine-type recombinase/integrase n=1 Tax=Ruthenibacterium lactatiformans TaxID=1550024 RepID=UPI00210A64AF|nr:tyrosine-type recombinase/integrase [Ruthenibacterium lactatiformans]MCQ5089999.1 tyrosine-type recombinase/integrase [Ruthenibacterium lactatiformans]